MEIKRNPKAPSNRRGWSTADDSTLIKMARGGASGSEIAKILGRTIMAVTTRKHILHVDVRLKSSKGNGLDVPKSISVNNKKKRKELAPIVVSRTPVSQPVTVNVTKTKVANQPWTAGDDAELLKLSAKGNSAKLIAKILGRTTAAVTIRKSGLKKAANAQPKVDVKKAAMLLRMEKMRAAKGKAKNAPAPKKTVPVRVTEKVEVITPATNEPAVLESDFDALSRIAKSTGATITIVFNK
jgi:DNA-binding CsgD family transcriptional regulator